MSIWEGLQSVAFHYLSCSPCYKFSHRREAKALSKREHAERAQLEKEQPGLYLHPSPFSTNPYWQGEIAMGPSPVRGKKTKQTLEAPQVVKVEPDTAVTTVSKAPTIPEDTTTTTQVDTNVVVPFDPSTIVESLPQKPAEAHITSPHVASSFDGSESTYGGSALDPETRPTSKRVPSTNTQYYPYFEPKAAPVNDLHPPIVSKHPSSKEAAAWMKAPPPSAAVMEGKGQVDGGVEDGGDAESI